MFIDGTDADPSIETRYDVVIVGAGPAGITMAMELMPTGLRIALLESGGKEFEGDPQDLNIGRIEGNDDHYDLDGSRLRYLGGTSNHWGGHCTPMDPIDFSRAPATGLTGWPFGRDTLDTFYARAHDYCDLGRFDYDTNALAPEDPDLRLLAENEELETVVIRQSEPTRFGEKYHDALAASDTVHVWLNTTAMNLASSETDRPWVDTTTFNQQQRRFEARAVVLAAGAIENTRLMQWANAQNQTRAGDAGELLGRCYMDHPSGGAAFLHFASPVTEKLYWTDIDRYADDGVPLHFLWRMTDEALETRGLPNFQYIVIPFADSEAERARLATAQASDRGMRSFAKWALGRDNGPGFSPAAAYCDAVTGVDELLALKARTRFVGDTWTRVLLKYEAEQRPDLTNRVELDPVERDALGMPRPVLTWKPGADDIGAIQETALLMGQFAGAAGLGRVELEDHDDDPFWGITTAWHQLGTMRMADNPRAGVVDADCRVHGTSLVYVASGAVFPSVGRANPTLTIVALTIRLADHLKRKLA